MRVWPVDQCPISGGRTGLGEGLDVRAPTARRKRTHTRMSAGKAFGSLRRFRTRRAMRTLDGPLADASMRRHERRDAAGVSDPRGRVRSEHDTVVPRGSKGSLYIADEFPERRRAVDRQVRGDIRRRHRACGLRVPNAGAPLAAYAERSLPRSDLPRRRACRGGAGCRHAFSSASPSPASPAARTEGSIPILPNETSRGGSQEARQVPSPSMRSRRRGRVVGAASSGC